MARKKAGLLCAYVGNDPINLADPSGLMAMAALHNAVNVAVPGAYYSDLAAQQAQQGNYGTATAYGVAAVADAFLGVVTAGQSTRGASAIRTGLATAEATENLVYRSVNAAGQVNYVGITNSLERRAAEHLGSKGISIDGIPGLGGLTRADAKAVEQVLIEYHGLGKNGGTLTNKINSIARSNPTYAESIQRGREILRQSGYSGF